MTGRRGVRRPSRGRAGFTLVELTIALAIMGSLAAIAGPNIRSAIFRADAARVRADVNTIQQAAIQYYEEEREFPRNAAWNTVPPALVALLPEGFAFQYKEAEYRWRMQRRTGRVRLQIRYPRDSEIGEAMKRFRSDLVTWTRRQTTFTLFE